MEKDELLRDIITLLLHLNPEPTDAQVHAFAAACNVDKETLEAKMYEMLGEQEGVLDDTEITADSQEILENVGADPDLMPLQDVAMNDGDPTNEDIGMQEETHDDGTDAEDIGIGFTSDAVLTDDGAPAVG